MYSSAILKQRMAETEVKLLGYRLSHYALLVEWALQLKGIKYEYLEEDLANKSQLLLRSNPVHKKIPVLIHNGKPVAESLIIVEYIDEAWPQNPLLPKDPYERAKAHFWAKFFRDKCLPAMKSAFVTQGEGKEKAAEDAREQLRTLESGLEGKQFFGGERIGFVDITAGWIGIWANMAKEVAGVNLIDGEKMPVLAAWLKNFIEVPAIKSSVPPLDKLLEHVEDLYKRATAGST